MSMLKRDVACTQKITDTLRIELTQEKNMLEVFHHQK
jgi:hypothetical protein